MRRRDSSSWPKRLLAIVILLTTFTGPALSIPYSRTKRQSPFDDLGILASSPSLLPRRAPRVEQDAFPNPPRRPTVKSPWIPGILVRRSSNPTLTSLQIPSCALTCYINALTTDSCSSETDFKCHCSTGNILGKAYSCIDKSCSQKDKADAVYKIKEACEAAGAGGGGGGAGDGNGDGDGTTTDGSDNTSSTRAGGGSGTSTTGGESGSSGQATATESASNPGSTGGSNSTPVPAPAPGATSSSPRPPASMPTNGPTATSGSPDPTDTPLALLPADRQLSPGAKAGISVSVSIFAISILVSIFLYIRRLKHDLKLAQAAAGVPESVWRASIDTAATPAGLGRRRSWTPGRGRSRRRSSWGSESPVSPLSPTGMSEAADSIPGVLAKKKRGHVLSVVVEREEEDSRPTSTHRIIHEPVPGQKEGLVDPLELDGEYTGIVELPTSITPRARSMERNRERGASLGESSRPSTGGLEKIDERSGL